VGIILPVQDITADKEGYYRIVCITGFFIGMLYITFSEFCLMAWGDTFNDAEPLITDYLP
jgi:hypothetical protein